MNKKVMGTWNRQPAFTLDGELFLIIGDNNGWVRKGCDTSQFEPYTAADLNDPRPAEAVLLLAYSERRARRSQQGVVTAALRQGTLKTSATGSRAALCREMFPVLRIDV